jgi:hypothetical protein
MEAEQICNASGGNCRQSSNRTIGAYLTADLEPP